MTLLMLTPEEVARLTGKKRVSDQLAWLNRYGIPCRVNDCREVIVARAVAERFLGVEPAEKPPEADLNWKAMRRLGIVRVRGTP